MASDTTTTVSPQLVSGHSAFWILVSLATAAVTQPSTCSRRKGRDLFGGKFDLFRCVPLICFFDGIIDVITLVRAYRDKSSPLPTQDADQGRRRLPPLKPNVVAAMLAISILTILLPAIKLFSMRGILWTQFCASLYFFAITTKLVIEFSRLETDCDDPDLTVIYSILELLNFSSPLIMEVAIWYNMSVPIMALIPSDDLNLRQNMRIISAFLVIELFAYKSQKGFSFPELCGPIVGRIMPWIIIMVFLLILSGTTGTMSYESQFEQQLEVRKAQLEKVLSRFEGLAYAIVLMACVGFVSIFIANTIGAFGHLIASCGQIQTSSPDTRADPIPEPINSSSGGQPEASDATGLSTAHDESRSRMSMASRRSWTPGTQISRSTRDKSVSRTPMTLLRSCID